MIEFIAEYLLTFVVEMALQVFTELLIEFGFGSLAETLRPRGRAHPILAGIGVVIAGAIAGFISTLIWPSRIFDWSTLPGISLLLSPLATGLVMDRYGEWCEDRGRPRSFLGTFTGGALFAFAMALVRFVRVGL